MNTQIQHLFTTETENIIIQGCGVMRVNSCTLIHSDFKVIHLHKAARIVYSILYYIIWQVVLVSQIVEMPKGISIYRMIEIKRRVVNGSIKMCVHYITLFEVKNLLLYNRRQSCQAFG